MPHTFQKEYALAIAAVSQAALLTQAVQRDILPDVIEKKDRSPVTVADFGSQALVCSMIHDAFPKDPVLAEEDAAALREPDHLTSRNEVVRRVQAINHDAHEDDVLDWIDYGNARHYHDRFWTLDPIDGTKGFLRGEQYAIALALIVEGEVCVAALACPNLLDPADGYSGYVYAATKGQGATRMPLAAPGKHQPVHTSKRHDPTTALFCESVEAGHSSHDDALLIADHLGIRTASLRLDSQAKYAVVAQGLGDIYLRLPTASSVPYIEKIWDHAAGALIVTEAGGQVTDIHGNALDFRYGLRLERNRGVIATNGLLHDKVLAAVASVSVPGM